jgi:hypothetical protein
MTKVTDRLSPKDVAAARERLLEAMHLQAIEGNPLDEQDMQCSRCSSARAGMMIAVSLTSWKSP